MEKDELEPVDIEADKSPDHVITAASPLKANNSNLAPAPQPVEIHQPLLRLSKNANFMNTCFHTSEKENLVNNLNHHLLSCNVNCLATNLKLSSYHKTLLQQQQSEQPQQNIASLFNADTSLHSIVTNPESLLTTQQKVQDLQAQVLKTQAEIKRNNAIAS